MINFLRKTSAVIFCYGVTVFVHAGFSSGPYIVWVNLDEGESLQVTNELFSYAKELRTNTFCGDAAAGWILYINSRPDGITNVLVKNALMHHDERSKKTLLSLIKGYRDKITETNEGLDGIVVYSPENGGRLISMDARGKMLSASYKKNSEKPNEFSKKFCKVNPKIYRK